LSRAEHRRCGRQRARGLSERAASGRVSACAGRDGDAQGSAKHRGTRAHSFGSVFFREKENEQSKKDGAVKSRWGNPFVIPAQAGIQSFQWFMDSRLRGSDGLRTFYEFIKKDRPPKVACFDRYYPWDKIAATRSRKSSPDGSVATSSIASGESAPSPSSTARAICF